MIPLQLPLPGLGSGTLLIGGVVFALVLAGVLAYVFLVMRDGGNPWDAFADACHEIVDAEDADAIAFIGYRDGPLLPKPAIYDRELLGGTGGYRTPDGERIYVDGDGTGSFDLQGVTCLLAIDPTSHAAAADPLKAWTAYQKGIGRWIKVDREGTLIEAGEALQSVDDVTPAMDEPKGATAADGGHPSEVHRHAVENGMDLETAKRELEEADLLHKMVDVAPPREAVVDEETGEVHVEEATHVAVDVADAADLLPKKTNTTEWQTMEEKARQEGRDDEKLKEYAVMFTVIGGAIGGVIGVIMALIFAFT